MTALSFAFCSCEKTKFSIGGKVTYSFHYLLHSESDGQLTPGDIIVIDNIRFTPKDPKAGVKIKHVDFFLGNKLIGASASEPHSLFYQIPEDTTPGNYVMHIDFYLTASSDKYIDTRYSVNQAVLIVSPPKK